MTDHEIAPEFSRTILADKVGTDETVQTIKAKPDECVRLAERLALQSLENFSAVIRLRRIRGGKMIRVSGRLEADVVQTCVVTLDPVPAHVSDEFETIFAPAHLIPAVAPEVEIDAEAEDPPEPLIDNRIDLGELTTQHLSLALDPYPRCPGTGFEDHIEEEEEAPVQRPNPFLALAKLKRPD